MLSYRQLEHFVTVAQELHFSRAADKLGVAQSAVSVQVQQLEQQLGVRLLQRNKRKPITLTDAGDNPITRRVLPPVDWLPATQPREAFGARGAIELRIPFAAPTLAPTGYRIYAFYP